VGFFLLILGLRRIPQGCGSGPFEEALAGNIRGLWLEESYSQASRRCPVGFQVEEICGRRKIGVRGRWSFVHRCRGKRNILPRHGTYFRGPMATYSELWTDGFAL